MEMEKLTKCLSSKLIAGKKLADTHSNKTQIKNMQVGTVVK